MSMQIDSRTAAMAKKSTKSVGTMFPLATPIARQQH